MTSIFQIGTIVVWDICWTICFTSSLTDTKSVKLGLHISRKDRKHMFANTFLNLSTYALVFTKL